MLALREGHPFIKKNPRELVGNGALGELLQGQGTELLCVQALFSGNLVPKYSIVLEFGGRCK